MCSEYYSSSVVGGCAPRPRLARSQVARRSRRKEMCFSSSISLALASRPRAPTADAPSRVRARESSWPWRPNAERNPLQPWATPQWPGGGTAHVHTPQQYARDSAPQSTSNTHPLGRARSFTPRLLQRGWAERLGPSRLARRPPRRGWGQRRRSGASRRRAARRRRCRARRADPP